MKAKLSAFSNQLSATTNQRRSVTMKRVSILISDRLPVPAGHTCSAQVPGIINYQGRVSVGGTNFDGTGQFKFALVNATGSTTYWSNGGNVHPSPSSLTVTKGLYSVLLGDTTITNMDSPSRPPCSPTPTCGCASGSTTASAASSNSPRPAPRRCRLRHDGGQRARWRDHLGKIAAGAVGSVQLADGSIEPQDLNVPSFSTTFWRPTATRARCSACTSSERRTTGCWKSG